MSTSAPQTERRMLSIRLLTPEGAAFEGEAYMVVAPSVQGEIGLLPRHMPIIAQLKVGDVRMKDAEGEVTVYATTEGYLSMEEDHVLIVVAQAELAADIDRARAEAQLRRAEEDLTAAGEDETARMAAENRRVRNENRLRVAEKYGAR